MPKRRRIRSIRTDAYDIGSQMRFNYTILTDGKKSATFKPRRFGGILVTRYKAGKVLNTGLNIRRK